MARDIIPFDPKGGGKLVSKEQLEAARRRFETPAREMTLSEIHSYYGRTKRRPEIPKGLIPSNVQTRLPSLLTKYNTLERMRRQSGAGDARKKAEKAIFEMLSFDKGFERLRGSQKHFDLDFKLIKLIQETYHNPAAKRKNLTKEESKDLAASLSSEEVTWLSVTKGIPGIIYEHKLGPVPGILDYFFDGVEWGLDTLSQGDSIERRVRDSYEALGITGVRSDTIFTPFKPEFTLALKTLYFAMVSDGQVFDRAMSELGTALLLSGDTNILRKFAARKGVAASDELGRQLKPEILRFLSSHSIINIMKGTVLEPFEAVSLFGMLEEVPDCVFDRQYTAFIPSGKGVMFLDPQTLAEIEYVPFGPFPAHYAQTEIYHVSQAIDRENAIWRYVFRGIRARIQTENRKKRSTTMIEELATKIKKRFDIDVALGVEQFKDKGAAAYGGKETRYTVKMGYWDLLNVYMILDKIPKRLLAGIKKIERRASGSLYEEMTTGTRQSGYYTQHDKILTLVIPPPKGEDPDADIIMPASDISYFYTVAHEVGHAVHLNSPEIISTWAMLSEAKTGYPTDQREGKFMTAYASTNPKEDFAEHFACYVVFPDEFKKTAEGNPVLTAKYDFMKRIFRGQEYQQTFIVPLMSLRGPLTYDYELRKRVLEESKKRDMSEVMTEEFVRRMKFEAKRDRSLDHTSATDKGPVIEGVQAIEEQQGKKRKKKLPQPRKYHFPSEFDQRKFLLHVLKKILGAKAGFVDVELLDYRLSSDKEDLAALEIANSLGVDKSIGKRIAKTCGEHLKKMEGWLSKAEADIDSAEEDRREERRS